jgi:hypothetical protein
VSLPKILTAVFLGLTAFVIGVTLAFVLVGCASSPATLPSRPPTGNHGQGQSPPAECPHQHQMTVDLPDGSGTFFIYCWGAET